VYAEVTQYVFADVAIRKQLQHLAASDLLPSCSCAFSRELIDAFTLLVSVPDGSTLLVGCTRSNRPGWKLRPVPGTY